MKKPAAPPVPPERHRQRIRHRDNAGKFKTPPSADDPGPQGDPGAYPGNGDGPYGGLLQGNYGQPDEGSLDSDSPTTFDNDPPMQGGNN